MQFQTRQNYIMWVLTTLLSYVLNIWPNASFGSTAAVLRAWDRPGRRPSALRAIPAAVAARSAGVGKSLAPRPRRRCEEPAGSGEKLRGFFIFYFFFFIQHSPGVLRGLRNGLGAPPALPSLRSPPSAGGRHCRGQGKGLCGDSRCRSNGVSNT